MIGKWNLQTGKAFGIDEFLCLRSKANSFKCGSDKKINSKRSPNLN